MIRYALKCDKGHSFESWFQSATAFDTLAGSGHVTCPECGSADVAKAMMSPGVRTDKPAKLTAPGANQKREIAALKAKIEAESEYVGLRFAKVARAIHDGESPERPIYGEAKPEDARKLIEDGVPVAPLPFTPTRKTN